MMVLTAYDYNWEAKMNIDLFKVMTFKEATDYLDRSPSYLNNMVATGRLIEGEHYRTAGGSKLVLRSVVEQIKAGHKTLTVEERENIIKECVEIDEALEKAKEFVDALKKIDGFTGRILKDIDRTNR